MLIHPRNTHWNQWTERGTHPFSPNPFGEGITSIGSPNLFAERLACACYLCKRTLYRSVIGRIHIWLRAINDCKLLIHDSGSGRYCFRGIGYLISGNICYSLFLACGETHLRNRKLGKKRKDLLMIDEITFWAIPIIPCYYKSNKSYSKDNHKTELLWHCSSPYKQSQRWNRSHNSYSGSTI